MDGQYFMSLKPWVKLGASKWKNIRQQSQKSTFLPIAHHLGTVALKKFLHAFSYSFLWWFITGHGIQLPVLHSRTLLFIHPVSCSLHLLIPNSQSTPLPTSPPIWQPQVGSLCGSCSSSPSAWKLFLIYLVVTTQKPSPPPSPPSPLKDLSSFIVFLTSTSMGN